MGRRKKFNKVERGYKIMELKEGEKYLSISLFGGEIKLAAFPNKKKAKETDPDFLGNGIAVWVSEKKAKAEAALIKPASL